MLRTLVLSAVLASTFAAAEVPTLSISGGYSTQVFTARGYDLVGVDDNLHQGRIALGTGFTLPFGWLDVEVGFATGGTVSTTHGTIPAEFILKGLQLGVSYRVPVTRWFHPYVQLAGGYDWATLTLADETRLTQTVSNVSGTGLLGVQFAIRMGGHKETRVPWLTFDLGAGAVIRPASHFDAMGPQAAAKPPADAIPSASVNLGTVPPSGFTARILVGVRF
jgi:hypothetical protein